MTDERFKKREWFFPVPLSFPCLFHYFMGDAYMILRKARRGHEGIHSLRTSKQRKQTKEQQNSPTEGKVKPLACHFQFCSPHEQISVWNVLALPATRTVWMPRRVLCALPPAFTRLSLTPRPDEHRQRQRLTCQPIALAPWPCQGWLDRARDGERDSLETRTLPLEAVFAPCQENSSLEKHCLLVKWTESVNND